MYGWVLHHIVPTRYWIRSFVSMKRTGNKGRIECCDDIMWYRGLRRRRLRVNPVSSYSRNVLGAWWYWRDCGTLRLIGNISLVVGHLIWFGSLPLAIQLPVIRCCGPALVLARSSCLCQPKKKKILAYIITNLFSSTSL